MGNLPCKQQFLLHMYYEAAKKKVRAICSRWECEYEMDDLEINNPNYRTLLDPVVIVRLWKLICFRVDAIFVERDCNFEMDNILKRLNGL